MKVIIPEDLSGKELFDFLIENKTALIAQKKSIIKYTEPVSSVPEYFTKRTDGVVKTLIGDISPDAATLTVKVVANTAMWCDSQMDVLLPNNAKKSIRDRKGLIPHLHDHEHTLDAEIGDVKSIYYEDVSLRELGVKQEGSAQALIFETEVIKSYNEKVFNKYKTGRIKQHSIGLLYVHIELAINDEDSEKEFDFWKKYIDKIINKEFVESKGFFWVVSEIKLLENSAVLFGSNELTPTLEVKADTENQPPHDTDDQPPHEVFDLSEAIRNTKFF